MAENSSGGGGIGILGALGLIFVTLKLLAVDPVAAWSWWWVTLPFWGGFALLIAFVVIAALGAGTFSLFDGITKRNKWKDEDFDL